MPSLKLITPDLAKLVHQLWKKETSAKEIAQDVKKSPIWDSFIVQGFDRITGEKGNAKPRGRKRIEQLDDKKLLERIPEDNPNVTTEFNGSPENRT